MPLLCQLHALLDPEQILMENKAAEVRHRVQGGAWQEWGEGGCARVCIVREKEIKVQGTVLMGACMCVCMHVWACMHVCTWACMHVCVCVCMWEGRGTGRSPVRLACSEICSVRIVGSRLEYAAFWGLPPGTC